MPELGLESAGFACCSCGDELPKLAGTPEKFNLVCCYYTEEDAAEHVCVGSLLKPDWPTSIDETGRPRRTFCKRTLVAVSKQGEVQKPGNVPCYYCPSCWAQRSFHDDEHGDVVCLCEARDIGLPVDDGSDDGSEVSELMMPPAMSGLSNLSLNSWSSNASSVLSSHQQHLHTHPPATARPQHSQHQQLPQHDNDPDSAHIRMYTGKSNKRKKRLAGVTHYACFALNLVAPGSGLGLMAAVNAGFTWSMRGMVSGALKQLLRYDANSDGRLSLPEMRATLEELDGMEGCRRGKKLYVRHMLRFLIRVHEIYRRNPHVACKQMANSLNMVDKATCKSLVEKHAPQDPLLVWTLFAWYNSPKQHKLATAIEQGREESEEEELEGLDVLVGDKELEGEVENALGNVLGAALG